MNPELESVDLLERFEDVAVLLLQAMDSLRKDLGAAKTRKGRTVLPYSHLSDREREVMHLAVDGLTNKEIARKLNITTFTVKSHIHTILSKTGISSRLKLAAVVREERKGKTIKLKHKEHP
jgi:DNA-binding NarL/FixJ family response regulator